jgi:phosphohistidine phosphatase SixA
MRNETSFAAAIRQRWHVLLPLLAVVGTAHAQTLSGKSLVAALQGGGYVILMRHASSPRTPPDAAHAQRDNVQHERQLDDEGRSTARAMGAALRQMRIPIGQVQSSPTYRALETIRLAQLGTPKIDPQLGDSGQSMQADSSGTRATWLQEKVAQKPLAGTNTIIVTHFPNINEAFAGNAAGLGDGEALIFHPIGHAPALFVGRVKIEEWPQLATTYSHQRE